MVLRRAARGGPRRARRSRRLPAAGRDRSTPSSRSTSSAPCAAGSGSWPRARAASARARRRRGETGSARAQLAAAAAAGAGPEVTLVLEPDVGPLAARSSGRRPRSRSRAAADGAGGFAVAVHGGGEAVPGRVRRRRPARRAVAPGRARRGPRRQGAARVHGRPERPGVRHRRRRLPAGARAAGEGTDAVRARRRATTARRSSRARPPRRPRPRAPSSPGAWPRQQRPRLVEFGLERLFREIELPLVRVLAQMEAAGVKMDPYRLGEITARVRDRVDEVHDEIHGAGRRAVHHRLAAAARRGALRPPRPAARQEGQDRLLHRRARAARPARPARHRAAGRGVARAHQAAQHLPRAAARSTSTRAPAGVHTTFNQLVAATGRLSSNNPNLQNIPVRTELGAEIRACFVAEDGHKLVVADYSQIELRLMALLSQEPALLEAYHRARTCTASPRRPWPASPSRRSPSASASAPRRPTSASCTASRRSASPSRSRSRWTRRRPSSTPTSPSTRSVKEFRERVIAQATQDGYVTTLFGRRRAVPELRSSNFRNCARSASAWRSTRSCRARPPTSSRSRW